MWFQFCSLTLGTWVAKDTVVRNAKIIQNFIMLINTFLTTNLKLSVSLYILYQTILSLSEKMGRTNSIFINILGPIDWHMH